MTASKYQFQLGNDVVYDEEICCDVARANVVGNINRIAVGEWK